jgi:hypothetical protein
MREKIKVELEIYQIMRAQDQQSQAGVSPLDAPASTRAAEASIADGWFRTLTAEVYS